MYIQRDFVLLHSSQFRCILRLFLGPEEDAEGEVPAGKGVGPLEAKDVLGFGRSMPEPC
jgi:hypothetical protein